MINYHIQAINPNAHLFQVELFIEQPCTHGQKIYLPNWIPGSYMIRDFSKHIQWLKAESLSGESLRIEKLDKSSWQLEPCNDSIKVIYQVYAWDLSVRGAHLDQTHGFFNGTSVFLAVAGQEDDVCQVEIVKPSGKEYQDWRVATGLQLVDGTQEFGFGTYTAQNYDELIDCPVEMADFTVISFEACNIPHYMVLTGRHQCDEQRLKGDLIKICEHHLNFFGLPAPMDRYVFMTYVLGNGFGGLEHRNSTALHCSREDLPLKTDDPTKVKKSYQQFLDLCSHEYFHTWNVKRIKPKAFIPYDTSQESYTELLWAFEGITSYYDSLALVQSGVLDAKDYLHRLAKSLTSVERSKGRYVQPVTDSSFDAWTKYYKQDENAPNSVISYYTKGAQIALCLDLMIRSETDGEKSLQNIMQQLWDNHGKVNIGVENNTIQNLVYALVGADKKPVFEAFFDQALYSTDDFNVTACLERFGVKLETGTRKSISDRGGFISEPLENSIKSSLAIEYSSKVTGILVKNVYLNGAASKAGISAGDHLIAINGLKVNHSDFEQRMSEFAVGQRLEIVGFRRDELMIFQVELEAAEKDTVYLSLADNNKDQELKEFRQWLALD
ncbi:MAG: M61 family metallopeptidase [Kangiellaceae bacterium]|nr:M61 family metallopeptidase [Kangiellaceae bacterium]